LAVILKQRLALTGALIVAFFALAAIVGPRVAPYGPTQQHAQSRLQPPGATYWLGTDEFGRDIFSRLLYGAGISFQVGVIALGASTPHVLALHVFPNITAPLIVHASLNFAFAVLAEASLAFLGLGNKPPSPSWGSMLSSSYGFLELAPWAALFPGLAIALTVLGFNLLGDGLRDALDPRLRT